MSEKMTLARPYAQAAFDWAKEKNSLDFWEDMLSKMTCLTLNRQVMGFVDSHQKSLLEIEAGLNTLTAGWVDDAGLRFLNLLTQNHRFDLLPFIYKRFVELSREHQKTLCVRVETPYPLSDTLLAQLSGALKKRFQQAVQIEQHIDPDLWAGVRIRFGDQVLDHTLQGRFTRLESVLMAV